MNKKELFAIVLVLVGLLLPSFAIFYYNQSIFHSPNKIWIVADQYNFSPTEIVVKKGDLVQIYLISKDVMHGFDLHGYEGVTVNIYPGEAVMVEFVAHKTGEFEFMCSVICGDKKKHDLMVGKFIVLE